MSPRPRCLVLPQSGHGLQAFAIAKWGPEDMISRSRQRLGGACDLR